MKQGREQTLSVIYHNSTNYDQRVQSVTVSGPPPMRPISTLLINLRHVIDGIAYRHTSRFVATCGVATIG